MANQYEPSFSDDELLAQWRIDPSSRRLAKFFGVGQAAINKRLARLRREGRLEVEPDVQREMTQEQILASVPTHGPNGAKLSQVDVRLWGVAAKDADGNLVTQGLNGLRARYIVNDAAEQKPWPAIGPMYSVPISVYTPLPVVDSDFERVFIWGDTQAHFWRENGNLIPFHDERAIDCGLQALARYRPHRVVILGDFFDFPGFGRYRKEPAFAFMVNAAIAYCTHLIHRIRSIVGDDCAIDFLPGNHEARIMIAILENLMELYGIRRPGDKFSLLSIPYLLNFEKYNIKCAAQFPSGEVWLSDDLVCLHKPDPKIASTQICGHEVRGTVKSDTLHYRYHSSTNKTIIVPGFGDYNRKTLDNDRIQRTNIPSGVGRSSAEQAFATVEITKDTRRHKVTVWEIEDGACFFKDAFIRGTAEQWSYDEAA